MFGSQCSDRPGNRTPPSPRLGLHTFAQCCCGNVAILNKYQPSSSNCDVRVWVEWREELVDPLDQWWRRQVSRSPEVQTTLSGNSIHSCHGEFYDECYLNNCDVCVVRSLSGPLDQWWRRQVSPVSWGSDHFLFLSCCVVSLLVKPWINSLVLKASLPF